MLAGYSSFAQVTGTFGAVCLSLEIEPEVSNDPANAHTPSLRIYDGGAAAASCIQSGRRRRLLTDQLKADQPVAAAPDVARPAQPDASPRPICSRLSGAIKACRKQASWS
jgi:hypothetical protein